MSNNKNLKVLIETCANPQAIVVHTKFDISKVSNLKKEVEKVPGVEPLTTFNVNKYSFLVTFGKLYTVEEISNNVLKAIMQKVDI